ncbi:MAG: hypothetical protein K8R73_11825, partial [Clostridiales bacterium]|nr:hypothetical protein [Clostridiales bacterium]
IEIESNMNSKDDVFLTVLYPTSISDSISTVTGLSGTNYKGVQINGTVTKIALFSNSTNEETKESIYNFSIDSTSDLQILVCDLTVGEYKVYKNNSHIMTTNVSDNSVLFIQTSGGGDFKIKGVNSFSGVGNSLEIVCKKCLSCGYTSDNSFTVCPSCGKKCGSQ